jgi:hypothetical protein
MQDPRDAALAAHVIGRALADCHRALAAIRVPLQRWAKLAYARRSRRSTA